MKMQVSSKVYLNSKIRNLFKGGKQFFIFNNYKVNKNFFFAKILLIINNEFKKSESFEKFQEKSL